MDGRWHLGANDPDVIGWLTAAAYFAAAVVCGMCGRAARIGNDPASGMRRQFWRASAALMVVPGIDKQLDLQTPLIAFGREVAKANGWYPKGQLLKWWGVAGLGAAAGGGLAFMAWRVRRSWREFRLAVLGIAVLLAFVVMRSAPERVDLVFPVTHAVAGKRHILELGGILCMGIAAAVDLRRNRRCRE